MSSASSRPSAPTRRSTKAEYIETDTGNKISRKHHIEGTSNIMLGGKSVVMAGVHMRAGLRRLPESSGEKESKAPQHAITIGRYSVISTDCTLRPPSRLHSGQMTYYPMRIGDSVFIGHNTFVSSAGISSHVHIGENCVLGAFSLVKENSKILPNTVVPPNMVIPPGVVVAGRPARIVGEVGDGYGQGGSNEGEEWVEGSDLRELVRSIK